MVLLLAQYYNLPAISQRNALFTWLARNNATHVFDVPAGGFGSGLLTTDGVHPELGLQKLWAEMLIHWARLLILLDEWFPTRAVRSPVDAIRISVRRCGFAQQHRRVSARAARLLPWCRSLAGAARAAAAAGGRDGDELQNARLQLGPQPARGESGIEVPRPYSTPI